MPIEEILIMARSHELANKRAGEITATICKRNDRNDAGRTADKENKVARQSLLRLQKTKRRENLRRKYNRPCA